MRFSRTQLGGSGGVADTADRLLHRAGQFVHAGDYDDVRRTGDEAGHPVSVAVHVHRVPPLR